MATTQEVLWPWEYGSGYPPPEAAPTPPEMVQPQMIPGPRGFSRVWEQSMAPLADMPWYPMRGRGANFMQGFIRGSAGAARAQGMGRERENQARAQAADEANKEAKSEYKDRLKEWHRYQREAAQQMARDRQANIKAMFEQAARGIALPSRLAPFAPGYKAGDIVPESIYRDALNEWQMRTRPDKGGEPEKPQRLTPAQEMEAAANPMEVLAKLWDDRRNLRGGRGTPFDPLKYPAAAESAAAYRGQAEKNREAVRTGYRQGGAAPALIPVGEAERRRVVDAQRKGYTYAKFKAELDNASDAELARGGLNRDALLREAQRVLKDK